ncbi:MAG TPA: DUF4249 domain-containing protein [Bacteroidales bacterium]|nr:DUF4249 domain-containing protein [Bacteroidales bacterium]
MDKELQFKGYDEFRSRIVVHGFISPNNGVAVAVDKTLPVNDVTSDSYLEDAVIVLFEDGNPILNLVEIDSGFFTSPTSFTPSVGKGYHIEVTAPGFKEVISTVQYLVPEISLDSLLLVRDSLTHRGYYLNFSFKDPPELKNYYHFEYLSTDVPEYTFPYNEDREFILGSFSDNSFNGEYVWQTVQYSDRFNDPGTTVINGYLFSLSEDFNKFIESLDEYEYTKQTIFFPVTSSVYSNIAGGYGIFASYTYSIKYITHIID